VTRFRLRYQATDFELPDGEFSIGRSAACALSLDDALVSRQHITLHTDESSVEIEDLGSRNGALVNGQRVVGRQPLHHLDRIVIGAQELVLIEVGQSRRAHKPRSTVCAMCSAPLTPDATECPTCGTSTNESLRTLAGSTIELPVGALIDPNEVTEQASAFLLVVSIADKALALNRYTEAERILGRQLERLRGRAQDGKRLAPDVLHPATLYALRLAEGLSQPKWVDWVFEVHEALGAIPTTDTVDRLHAVVRAIRYIDARPLRAYLQKMGKVPNATPAERFVLQRLAGLQRVISA
jgi:ribosomal protein L40E